MTTEKDQEGVSEIVGYVIMLTIVLIAIGLVFANVVPVLDDTEETEHTKNSQRVFSVIQGNVGEIIENDVPSRGAEMSLKGGKLSVQQEATRLNVTINNTAGNEVYNSSDQLLPGSTLFIRHITYDTDAGTVSYENGAVIRSDSNGNSVMLEEPRWRIEEDGPVILPMIATRGRGTLSGNQVALIQTTQVGRSSLDAQNATDVDTVELEMKSPNADAWNGYLEGEENVDVTSFEDGEVVAVIDLNDQNLIYTENLITVRVAGS